MAITMTTGDTTRQNPAGTEAERSKVRGRSHTLKGCLSLVRKRIINASAFIGHMVLIVSPALSVGFNC